MTQRTDIRPAIRVTGPQRAKAWIVDSKNKNVAGPFANWTQAVEAKDPAGKFYFRKRDREFFTTEM